MISLHSQRVLFSDNAVLTDFSSELNKYRAEDASFSMIAAEDFIYIGQYTPFNSRYFDVTVASVAGELLTVDVWNGSQWQATVDNLDETGGFANSGYLTWTLDQDESGWAKEDSEDITGLTASPKIYGFYWVRIKASGDLGATTVNYTGNKFSTDDEMYSYYPALDNQIR